MKKRILFILLLVLGVSALPSSALGTTDLTALAQQLPASTLAYVSVRADDNFLVKLDKLVTNLGDKMQMGNTPPIMDTLDQGLQAFGGYKKVREWLGDSVAVAQLDFSSSVYVLSVADKTKAENALKAFAKIATNYSQKRSSHGIVYTSSSSYDPILLLTDDALYVVLYSVAEDPFAFLDETDKLIDNATFTATLGALPLDTYNIVGYVNVLSAVVPQLGMMTNGDALLGGLAGLANGVGPTAIGFTILDDRNLTIDIAQTLTDPQALAPIAPLVNRSAVDVAFADTIPADAQLVIHSTDLGALRQFGFNAIKTLGNYFDAQYETGDLSNDQQALLFIDDAVTFVELSFKGMSGQSMSDAFDWMTGDFAVYNRFAFDGRQLSIDMGVNVANTDRAKATSFVDGIAQLLDDSNIPTDRTNDTLVITALSELANALKTAPLPISDDNFSLVLGANDQVVTFGTYTIADEVLKGDFNKLSDTAAFQNASQYVLTNANTVLYANVNSLTEFVQAFNPNNNPLVAFESATVSVASTSESALNVRLVLTLNAK